MTCTVLLLACRKWAESKYHVSGDVARFNSADEDNFTQVPVPNIQVKILMSGWPTYCTYQNHADFLNVSVFPGYFEFSGIVCN
jgi:dissimilatory sulfite reductase (desulfoviridin) alpha/beta subunit